ncbi:MAG: 2-C-methyl-D-erythritol 2,4-cyclodiphosphate synthase [Cytophagales bacterium]|nr:2-C-methyl-D-erythritol 2,4-cyclodiphosphate synthase [Cytophagales bacterium]
MKLRIGQGYDVHRLEAGRPFVLGGITIPHSHGPAGHSDGDVLIHAICDALLGAANLRDIGYHFSDKDPQYKGMDSKVFLKRVVEMVRECGYEISNIDATVLLELPKVNPNLPHMQQVMAEVLSIRPEDISIKATTSEKIGFVGRGEGVSVFAVVLLYKILDGSARL